MFKMRNHKYFFILLAIAGLFAFTEMSEIGEGGKMMPLPEYCNGENITFQDGEEVTYKMYYQLNFLWLAAGEIVFKVKELDNTLKITCQGRTISAFEWFYKVRDYYETIIDKETMLPLEFTRDIQEGKFKLYNRFEFDQENKKVTSYKGRTKDDVKIEYYELSNCMHDMISILYFVRNMDIESYAVNDSFAVKVFLEEEYPLNVKVLEKDAVKRFKGLGKYKTHSVSPEVVAGHIFKDDTFMKVWFTADKNRIPLMIETPVSVGKVKAVLTSFRGLKHPFDAVYFK